VNDEPILDACGIPRYDSNNFEEALGKMIDEGHAKDTAAIWITEYILGEVYNAVMPSNYNKLDHDLYYNLSDENDANFANAYGALIERYVEIGDACGINFQFSVIDEPQDIAYRRLLCDVLYGIMKDPDYVDPDVDDPNYEVMTTVAYSPSCDLPCPNDKYNYEDGNIPPLTGLADYKVWHPGSIGAGYSRHNDPNDPNYHGHFGYYTTGHSHRANPIYNRFLHGLFAFRTDAKVVSAYAMGTYINDPYNDFDAGGDFIHPWSYPDFVFAYPTWSGELLYSIGGLEGIREGIKDAKYIATLEKLIP
jgi:hypothetical protein